MMRKRPFKIVSKIRRPRQQAYGIDWKTTSNNVKKRDGYRCQSCGNSTNLQVHHNIPVSRGGATNYFNLITLCESCHSKKPGHHHLKPRR